MSTLTLTSASSFKKSMMAAVRPDEFAALFDFLPMISFYAKDVNSRFFRANTRFVELHGCRAELELIGRTDFDFHPPEIAAAYIEEDRRVMASGQPLPHQAWMVRDAGGLLRWWMSSKTPLFGARRKVVGIAGAMYEISSAGAILEPYSRITAALQRVHEGYPENIEVRELARLCHLSVSQFHRIFQQIMRESPSRYLLRTRLDSARRLLASSSLTLDEMAPQVGLYDASNLVRRFREVFHQTPRQYREQLKSLARRGGLAAM